MDRIKRSVSIIARNYSPRSERRSPFSTSEANPSEGPAEYLSSNVQGNPQNSKLEVAKSILELINTAADAVPLPGLKAVTGSLLLLLNRCQKYNDNVEIVSDFLQSMEQLKQTLYLLQSQEYTDSAIHEQLTLLSEELEKFYLPRIKNLIPLPLEFTLKSVAARIKWIFLSREHEKLLSSFTMKINNSIHHLQLDVTCHNNAVMNHIDNTTKSLWKSERLKHLPFAIGALHESGDRVRCLDNTRTGLLKAINKWAHSNTVQRIFWLQGTQGTGKSTTAFSVADAHGEDPSNSYLGTFFGLQDYAIAQIVPTLAYQIGHRVPSFREHLLLVIDKDNNIGERKLSEQFKKLLVGPLRTMFSRQALPVMLILDGLDECRGREENGTDRLKIFLDALIECVREIQSMKVFISCRSIPQLQDVFDRNTDIFRTVSLDGDKLVDMDKDIQRFVDNRMPDKYRGDKEISLAIERVARKARGSFLYASDMLSLLLSGDRNDFLTQVNADDLNGTRAVHARYERLVVRALKKEPDEDLRRRLYDAMVAMASYFFEPLSVQNTSELFRIEPRRFLAFLEGFSTAHFEVKTLESPAHFAHVAFRDFLHQRTPSPPSAGVTIPTHHHHIVIHLFQYMRSNLRRNACGLLSDRHRDSIETQSVLKVSEGLRYTCLRWADHLSSGLSQGDDVSKATFELTFDSLQKFVQESLLYWLEVLCLLQRVDLAIGSLKKAVEWVNPESSPLHHRVHGWLNCMQHAVDTCKTVLEDYPLQVYETLLTPFVYETHQLAKRYPHVKTCVERVYFRSHQRTIKTGTVAHISFSHDGRWMATGNINGSLKLWNVHTGQQFSERESVYFERFEVSLHDLQLIGCDKMATVLSDTQGRYVEVTTCDCSQRSIPSIHVLQVPVGDVIQDSLKLITSPDQRYAGIVLEGSLYLWKTLSTSCTSSFRHRVSPSSVVALNSRHFISSRALHKIKDGSVIFEFHQPVSYGAFSSDGSVLAVGADHGEIYIYLNGQTHEQIAMLSCGSPAPSMSLDFSPDGAYLAMLGPSKVEIWKTRVPEKCVRKLTTEASHFGFRFSPKGKFFKVASLTDCGDMVIEAYHVGTSLRSQVITAAAFSSDGKYLATGSRDGRIAVYRVSDPPPLWEDYILSWLDPPYQKVDHISFSPDGRFLASTSEVGLTTLRTIAAPDSGLLVNELVDYKPIPFSAFSGNSRYLAAAYVNNSNRSFYVEMFDIVAGATSHILECTRNWGGGHTGIRFQSLALSEDGSTCAIASIDSLVLYSHERRPTVAGDVLRVHADRIGVINVPDARSLRFSDDGRYIISTAGVFRVKSEFSLERVTANVDSGRCFVHDGWIVDRFGKKKCCLLPYKKYDFWDSHGSQLVLGGGGGGVVFVRVCC